MKRAWLIVLAGALVTALVPFAFYKWVTGEFLPAMPPQLEHDTTYYLLLGKEFLDGHPALGNPYIKEHADAFFPGMHIALKAAMLPGLLGFDIAAIYAINIVLYSLITAVLLFSLCKYVAPKHVVMCALMSVLGVATMHNNLLRPGMQTIIPIFIVLMMALTWVLNNQHDPKRYLFLGAICALSFYLYPYSWMTAFTAVGLLFLWTAMQRDWRALKLQVLMGIGIVLICIPQIRSIALLFFDEATHELNVRIGLTKTHLILPITILNMKYVIVGVVGLLILSYKQKLTPAQRMTLLIGAALCIGSVSNLVTGKQMDFETHFYRLSLPWNIVAATVFLDTALRKKEVIGRLIALCCGGLLLLTSVNRAFIRANGFAYLFHADAIEVVDTELRSYEPVFEFLSNANDTEDVILTTPDISTNVPLYTREYVFYHPMIILNTIPNEELLERFVTYYVDYIDEDFLREKLIYVAGLGPKHTAVYQRAYGHDVTYLDFTDPNLLSDALELHKKISADYEAYIQKYNVRYVITDTNAVVNPRVPKRAQPIYNAGTYSIYELPTE